MKIPFRIRRILGYAAGFCLFYAPLALFQRLLNLLLGGGWQPQTIHSLCLRIPLEHIADGRFFHYAPVSVIATILLLLSAAVFGPLFCGRLCPAGAFTEALSCLVPKKYQISWRSCTETAPIRYGMLTGYMLMPLFGGILACSYCNFFVFDLFVNYFLAGYAVSLTSSLLLTLLLWAVLFGLFTQGGRGFCSFLCPVGAAQNLVHFCGRRLPFAYKLQFDEKKCTGCGQCASACPMQSITLHPAEDSLKASHCIHSCILCGCCENICPAHAIKYGRQT